VVRVGEPVPAEVVDDPTASAAYWFREVAQHPFFDPDKEHLTVLIQNTRLKCVGWNLVSMGTLNESLASPREIFRPLIAAAAYGFVLMHNHPSGFSDPSDADRKLTRRLKEASELLGIRLFDHVIVGRSFADLPFSFRLTGQL
jgi:DNA repair protein RadC